MKTDWFKERTTFVHGDERTVDKLPPCDFPHKEKITARYDARTVRGPWQFMCREHMKQHGIGVGLGLGQRLWLARERHAPGEIPIRELPPVRQEFQPRDSWCGRCGANWFEHALGYRDFIGYCPQCVRELPDRRDGPFTFGDVLVLKYPLGPANIMGEQLGRIHVFPCESAMQVRIVYENDDPPEDVQLFQDGLGTWWDVDNNIRGIDVRLGDSHDHSVWQRDSNYLRKQAREGAKTASLFAGNLRY